MSGDRYAELADRLLAGIEVPPELLDPPVVIAVAQAYATLAVAERLDEVAERLDAVVDSVGDVAERLDAVTDRLAELAARVDSAAVALEGGPR